MADAFILLGIVMAMVSLGFILINKLFCFISAGCLLSLCASMASLQLWDASYWGRWGKVCPGLDVIISCDNYHSLYDLGWGGNDSNLLIVFYVQIMPDDFVMQLHRF